MRKKILVVELSEAIRNITENILHQNGYDVITAVTAEKAKELIITSEPNMVIVGADIKDAQGIFLYEILNENETTSSIPLLLIADPDGRSLPYPDEVVLPRPFDPSDFLQRVRLFAGSSDEPKKEEKISTVDPFSVSAVDDEFLDAALGLDNLQVEESEEMDTTTTIHRSRKPSESEKPQEFGIAQPTAKEKKSGESQRVESLMIREDGRHERTEAKQKKPEMSASSKIEIPDDPYGLTGNEAVDPHPEKPADKKGLHDYEWFIDEMQKEAADIRFDAPVSGEDHKLDKEATGASLDPIKSNAPQAPQTSAPAPGEENREETEISHGNVDEFIAEFKKEMEYLNNLEKPDNKPSSNVPAPIPEPLPAPNTAEPDFSIPKGASESAILDKAAASDAKSPLSEDEMDRLAEKLVDELADHLAKRLLEKLDRKELHDAVKDVLPRLVSKSR